MLRKAFLLLFGVFFFARFSWAYVVLDTKDILFNMDAYWRNDVIGWKNVTSLDSHNKDDHTVYFGIDYSLAFTTEFKEAGPKYFLKIERHGPWEYDTPLFIHNTLMTNGGPIKKYRGTELLPHVEEWWLDTPLFNTLRFQLGLYNYEVGNAFSLNGSYENYGFTLYQKLENLTWRIYYCRPDFAYKINLGPLVRQEKEQGVKYNTNASNFFATDAIIQAGGSSFQPYVGVLADYTSPGKRENLFTAPIKRDLLGTAGLAWHLEHNNLVLSTEFAHNFGKAQSADAAFKDIVHTGYLFFGEAEYVLGKFTPFLKFLLTSGNKLDLDMALNQDSTLTSGKNRAFSQFSPLNLNIADAVSHNHNEMRPLVFTGAGDGLNYGIHRNNTLYSSDLDNLVMPAWGCDFNPTEKLSISLYAYYIRAFERGVGMFNGEPKYLPRELGYETDIFIDYMLNPNILFNLTFGYFLPGRYYKEERDDTDGSLFSPFIRGDGNANSAYQIEMSMELKF